jgi:hypothetical protein
MPYPASLEVTFWSQSFIAYAYSGSVAGATSGHFFCKRLLIDLAMQPTHGHTTGWEKSVFASPQLNGEVR